MSNDYRLLTDRFILGSIKFVVCKMVILRKMCNFFKKSAPKESEQCSLTFPGGGGVGHDKDPLFKVDPSQIISRNKFSL